MEARLSGALAALLTRDLSGEPGDEELKRYLETLVGNILREYRPRGGVAGESRPESRPDRDGADAAPGGPPPALHTLTQRPATLVSTHVPAGADQAVAYCFRVPIPKGGMVRKLRMDMPGLPSNVSALVTGDGDAPDVSVLVVVARVGGLIPPGLVWLGEVINFSGWYAFVARPGRKGSR
jgi:hypothetical protein